MHCAKDQIALVDEIDSVDSYFECITISACSIGEEGSACVTKCVELHLKSSFD